MKEMWKDIKGYEGLYQVSNCGRIKRIRFINNIANKPQNKLVGMNKIDNLGYRTICLCKNGKTKYKRVHRIVAEAFIPNPQNLPCVNHKDGNKKNNNVENLEWCTHSYNTKHAMKNGLFDMEKFRKATRQNVKIAQKNSSIPKGLKGEDSPSAVLKEKDVLEIRRAYSNKEMSSKQLSEKYGVHISTIQRILSRKTWAYLE